MVIDRRTNAPSDYYLRALALDPTNPLINLSLAVGYIHLGLSRNSLNRQDSLAQSLSFLFVYHDHRAASSDPVERQEAAFNVGRAFHMLGLPHLAVPYYERCLTLSEEIRSKAKKWKTAKEGLAAEGGKGGEASKGGETSKEGGTAEAAKEGETAKGGETAKEGDETQEEGQDDGCGDDDGALAAYCLQGIWARGGNMDKAREVTEKWLVI